MSQPARSVPFIVCTEACERLSFYGVVSILTLYLTREIKFSADQSREVVHLFKMAAYFLPLLGGWIADRFLGRYWTILSLSIFYCIGHATLALFEGNQWGIYAGLALIALGAGGIKPCVSAFVGDQFEIRTEEDRRSLERVYGMFYWAINFGAFFAFALIPMVRDRLGYRWAFGIPGIFMAMALLFFAAGTHRYVRKPAARQVAKPTPEERAERRKILLRIALVLAPVPVFWALFDQSNSTWVLQGTRMQPFDVLGYKVDSERIQSVGALLVMIWVPILSFGVYPWLTKRGWQLRPLVRMAMGMVFTAISFGICAVLETRLASGATVSLGWQLLAYLFLELGEVMVSATGLEFAYGQAPDSLKSTVMSIWFLTTSVGNLLVAIITGVNARWVHAQGTAEYLFYGGLMLAVAGLFAVIGKNYQKAGQSN